MFPNSVLVFHPTWLSHLELVPLATDRVRVIHRQLVSADAPADEESVSKRTRSFEQIDTMVFLTLIPSDSYAFTVHSGRSRVKLHVPHLPPCQSFSYL